MTPAQTRVLIVLLVVLGINVRYNEGVRTQLTGFTKLENYTSGNNPLSIVGKNIGWVGGAFILELITGPAPVVGQWLAFIILAFVVLRYAPDISSEVANATGHKTVGTAATVRKVG